MSRAINKMKNLVSRIRQIISKHPWISLLMVILIVVGFWAIMFAYQRGNLNFSGVTLWDWLELVIVPMTLAVGTYLFSTAQRKNEYLIAANQQEDTILQDYLNVMTELIIKNQLRGANGDTEKESDLRNVVRARTLTTLKSLVTLNASETKNRRKGSLLRFLYETELINGDRPIISLKKANFETTYARKFDLQNANLEQAYLSNADFRGANLTNTTLTDTRMINVNLRGADLTAAVLNGAKLEGAIYGVYNEKETIWPEGFNPEKNGAIKYTSDK